MNFPEEQRRILLIEDDYGNRVLFADFLEQCGYRVLPMADGNNCIEIMQEYMPHLVLMDIKLPQIDGVTLIQSIRQHPQFCTIPILVVSSYAFQADRRKAILAGATDYMVKPILPATLNSKILSLLKAPPIPIAPESGSPESDSSESDSSESDSFESDSFESDSFERGSQSSESDDSSGFWL